MLKPKRKRFRWQINCWTSYGQNIRKYFKHYKDAVKFSEVMHKNNFTVRGPFDNRNPQKINEADIDYYYRSYYGF